MIHLAIGLILILAVIAVVVWFMQRVAIPAPFNIIIWAALAIVALLVLASLAGFDGGGSLHWG